MMAAGYERRLAEWSDMQAYMPLLRERASGYERVRVLELGTRTGYSTSAFLAAAEATGGHVWSVDIAQPLVPPEWAVSGLWTLTVRDDTEPLPELDGLTFDVLFIDTSHFYDHTLTELRTFAPRVVPGGVVLLHDTAFKPDPVQGGWDVGGAVDAWCREAGRSWKEHGGPYGMAEIRV